MTCVLHGRACKPAMHSPGGGAPVSGPFHDQMTLREARDTLRPLAEKGHDCPLCTRRVKIYRRHLTSVAARGVLALYGECGSGWGHMAEVARKRLPDVAGQAGYLLLGQHWDLIEEDTRKRSDGGRAGWWRVTALGELWLKEEEAVPKYVRLYAGRRLSAPYGDLVTVRDALGQGFDFGHLVRAVTPRAERQHDEPLFPTAQREAA